jgi:hypothetical protein
MYSVAHPQENSPFLQLSIAETHTQRYKLLIFYPAFLRRKGGRRVVVGEIQEIHIFSSVLIYLSGSVLLSFQQFASVCLALCFCLSSSVMISLRQCDYIFPSICFHGSSNVLPLSF